jgi:hypothetical protein
MNLPKKHIRSTRGQILIIFILILVVGLAIVVSVASRTVTDIKVTNTADESNRAFFAAEAGIEDALQDLQSGGTIPSSGLSLQFTNAAASTTAVSATSSTFVYPDDVAKDGVVQLVLLSDFNDLTSPAWGGSTLNFYWGDDPTINNGTPAIEISVIYYCSSSAGCPGYSGQNFGISKIAFDPNLSRGGTAFCSSSVQALASPRTIDGKNFNFSASVHLYQLVENCNGLKLTDSITTKPLLARIRLLYNTSPVAVESSSTDPQLPSQGVTLESTGNTVSGVTRKLQVIRFYPALPSLFDYVLFSGSSGNLVK